MKFISALAVVFCLVLLALLGGGVGAFRTLLGAALPYIAGATFLIGVIMGTLAWVRCAVPFRIPTTSGQQKSLPWVKSGWLESPSTRLGAAMRMVLEVLLFRSLFRNSCVDLQDGPRLIFREEKLLWLAALAFHWSLLIVLVRHLRFFMEPVPGIVQVLQICDGFFQVGVPVFYLSDALILASLAYLLWRRLRGTQLRYLSLFGDYFVLCLLLGLAVTGILMRYFTKVDLLPIKEMALSLVTFSPVVPAGVGRLFWAHFVLLCVLLIYFPFSKLMHMAGIFFSPTRNLANNSRARRHINPWDHPVKVHAYDDWENEFRDKIQAAGLPLERQ